VLLVASGRRTAQLGGDRHARQVGMYSRARPSNCAETLKVSNTVLVLLTFRIYIMSLNDEQIQQLQYTYNDSSLALTTGKNLCDHLKSIGEAGYTLSKVNDFLKSLE
jgi:hypothetical protein